MPKLLIPLYAIDVQPFTATLTPTATATFDIGKAMSTDSREYAEFNNDGGKVVTHYTSFASMEAALTATYGADATPPTISVYLTVLIFLKQGR